jgi:hypothetical protein
VKPCAEWIELCEKDVLQGAKCETDVNLADDADLFRKVKLAGQQKKRGEKTKAGIRKTQRKHWKRKLWTSKKNKLKMWVKTKEHWRKQWK